MEKNLKYGERGFPLKQGCPCALVADPIPMMSVIVKCLCLYRIYNVDPLAFVLIVNVAQALWVEVVSLQ